MVALVSVSFIAVLLVVVSIFLHYTALRTCAKMVLHHEIAVKRPLVFVVAVVFLAHLAEVMLFAGAYYAMHWSDSLGKLVGDFSDDPSKLSRYFYFSISSYTTLGVGDIIPIGVIRILAGIEALTGLVLIAWSASFSYLMMEKLWQDSSLQ